MINALGIHVFAGGFTRGFQLHRDFNALGQLEIHGLGLETVRNHLRLNVSTAARWEDWPKCACDVVYGNPRCTGFSCLTGGYDSNVHGPWAKQTKDIHDLVDYSLSLNPQPRIVIFESVQQAYSTGRELIKYLRDEKFIPNGYRIAHLFINAASFNNAQRRMRYFFVAYKRDSNFNVSAPPLAVYRTTLRDVIEQFESLQTRTFKYRDTDYDGESWLYQNDEYMHCIERLPRGYNMNMLGKYMFDALPPRLQLKYTYRTSDMPFSMHCPYKLAYDVPAPTLWGACAFVHPNLPRLLTIRELSTIMGWDYIPQGRNPIGQIAKGVVPSVATWLAQQCVHYLNDDWGNDDFAAKYRAQLQAFEPALQTPDEKIFNLNEYVSQRDRVNELRNA